MMNTATASPAFIHLLAEIYPRLNIVILAGHVQCASTSEHELKNASVSAIFSGSVPRAIPVIKKGVYKAMILAPSPEKK